jgi:hypothetical protein
VVTGTLVTFAEGGRSFLVELPLLEAGDLSPSALGVAVLKVHELSSRIVIRE